MVTGLSGLLYASACETFLNYAKQDPAGASLLIRKFILEGVEINGTLEGFTSSGGRVDLFNSLKKMNEWCFNSSAVNNIETIADVSLFPNPSNGGTFSLLSFVEGSATITITDMSGKSISSATAEFQNGSQQTFINNLPAGVYHIRCVFDNAKVFSSRLIVQ
ncbi:MAG: T9SS type A sorting domain-containing protein [Bacteroidia bacterium]|nr:T9SS type A sorting domain-containing protein [Bacteroidia bacterium]